MTADQIRVRTNDDAVGRRSIPIPHVQVSATTSGAANDVFTVRDDVLLHVKQFAVTNITGSAATISLNAIPSGGSIGDSNAEAKDVSIAANTMVDLTNLIGQMYDEGTVMQVYSGTTNALVVHGWAEEIL